MASNAEVTRADDQGLVTLTLNRPDKLNSLTVIVFEALLEQIEAIAASPDSVGVVVLRGSGRCFSAGHDLRDIVAGEKPRKPNLQSHVIEKLANLPQPLIVAVHGYCYTGALEMALAGDIILASENARFADTHAKWSLTPIWGLSQRLPRRVGIAKASEMMFTCDTYSGVEAVAMGLANACYSDSVFWTEVERFARRMLSNSWFALRGNKRLLVETDGLPLPTGLAYEVYNHPGVGPDMHERIRAFTEKSSKRGKDA
jgi:enoyl-CoA hydratase